MSDVGPWLGRAKWERDEERHGSTRVSENFADSEFFCPCANAGCSGKRAPHPALVLKLEVIRQLLNRPIVINSGVRCPEHNARVGGVPGSAHETGEAADIHVSGSRDRMSLVQAAIKGGIGRVGVASSFVHVDTSRKHDQDVLWLYS